MLETTGVDVWGACGDFGFSERCWRLVLALGRHYGWRPEGTLPPDPDWFEDWCGDDASWDGRYYPPEGQRMTARDARALADALDRAVMDLPDHDALSLTSSDYAQRMGLLNAHLGPLSPLEAFSGSGKAMLRDFIVHCRECPEFWLC
jgi:hypothetical protein